MVEASSLLRRGQPIVWGFLLVFAFIEGCLTAWLVMKYNNNDNYPSHSVRDRVRFLVFVSWWTFITSALYIVAFFTEALSFLTSIAAEGTYVFVTWLLWLAGAAAFTQSISGGNTCGSDSTLVYCHQNVAAEAFAWIEWITFTFVFIGVAAFSVTRIRAGDRLGDSILGA